MTHPALITALCILATPRPASAEAPRCDPSLPLVAMAIAEGVIKDAKEAKALSYLSLGGGQLSSLEHNLVRSVRPLARLRQLSGLNLQSNRIKDVAPLAKVRGLSFVYLGKNLIEDFAALEKAGMRFSGESTQYPGSCLALLERGFPASVGVKQQGPYAICPPWEDAAVDALVREKSGENEPSCGRLERVCGPILGFDCGAAIDGAYNYVDGNTGESIASCGGHCMGASARTVHPNDGVAVSTNATVIRELLPNTPRAILS